MKSKSRIKTYLIGILFIVGSVGPASAALVLNPPPNPAITQWVTVQPIIVSDTGGGNTANFFGTTVQQMAIEGFIDMIWAQAGIDINFNMPTPWSNTFANWGINGPPNNGGVARPTADLNTVATDGATAGVISGNPNVINMFFVNIPAGFALLSADNAAGLADTPGNNITQFVGTNLLDFTGGREVIASVVAHEIGHNLGLDHIVLAENLMQAGGSANAGERLNSAQIATALASNLSVIPVPAAVWLFGSGLIGLIGIAKTKKA